MFNIESPNLHYVITVKLFVLEPIPIPIPVEEEQQQGEEVEEQEPKFIWRAVTNFTLSPDKTSGRSPDGRVGSHYNIKI